MCWKRQAIYQTPLLCTAAAQLQALFARFFCLKLPRDCARRHSRRYVTYWRIQAEPQRAGTSRFYGSAGAGITLAGGAPAPYPLKGASICVHANLPHAD